MTQSRTCSKGTLKFRKSKCLGNIITLSQTIPTGTLEFKAVLSELVGHRVVSILFQVFSNYGKSLAQDGHLPIQFGSVNTQNSNRDSFKCQSWGRVPAT